MTESLLYTHETNSVFKTICTSITKKKIFKKVYVPLFFSFFKFIWLHWVLVAPCGIQFSDQDSTLAPALRA